MVFSTIASPIYGSNKEINVYLDANEIEFDVPPQIINGRTMVPIRAIFEKMGANVEWDRLLILQYALKAILLLKWQ